jgi:F0F1-type ATP synthase membrane subunit c/vacuolar-type H+-ATPase subunit K
MVQPGKTREHERVGHLPFKENTELQAGLAFGLAGLVSGVISALVFVHASTMAEQQPVHHGPHLFVLFVYALPGGIFLVALMGCFVLCQTPEWPTLRSRPWRCLFAAVLISLNTLVATCAGFLAGVVATALIASPPTGEAFGPFHPPQHAHPLLFFSFPVVVGLIFGAFVGAIMLALALYIFTQVWDPASWAALIFFSAALLVVTLAINPKFLPLFYRPQETSNMLFGQTISILLILGYTLYGACAGYWIARSRRLARP